MFHAMSEPRNSLKPITAGLSPLFASLERRAQATIELAERVRALLPSPDKDHVTAASYRAETLVVLADSAAWAARIRYAQQELLSRLHAAGETRFTKLKVKVGRVGE
jgi:hypothetical protein